MSLVVLSGVLLTVLALAGRNSSGQPRDRAAVSPKYHILPAAPPRPQVTWTHHSVLLGSAVSSPPLYQTDYHILKVVWVSPPGGPEQLLILSAEDISQPQPRRSHLYLLDPARPGAARELSPESPYNFWDLSAGDVDGDGEEEVALCTYSRTARESEYKRRFFVYSWDERGDLYPRWRGSRLCRPYIWAGLADVTGDEQAELLSVEIGLRGGKLLMAYQWNQFGFWGLGHSEEWPYLQVVQPSVQLPDGGKGVEVIIATPTGERRRALLRLQDNTWHEYGRDQM